MAIASVLLNMLKNTKTVRTDFFMTLYSKAYRSYNSAPYRAAYYIKAMFEAFLWKGFEGRIMLIIKDRPCDVKPLPKRRRRRNPTL